MTEFLEFNGVTVTITRSAGGDNALVVFIDTAFEPDGSDGGPGLRVHVNDSEVYEGVPYIFDDLVLERLEAR